MTRSKGKLVAIAVAVGGIATLGAAGLAVRGWVVEEYYIWKLKSEDEAERDSAAKRLGELRSVRSVPALLEAMIRLGAPEALRTNGKVFTDGDIEFVGADSVPLFAVHAIGRSALPALSKAIDRGDPWFGPAYLCLVKMGGDGRNTGDVETLLLKVKEETAPISPIHRAATDLLPKVKAFRSRFSRR